MRPLAIGLILALLSVFMALPAIAADWYSPDWGYRVKVTVDQSKIPGTADLTDFPVFVDLRNVWGYSAWGLELQSDGSDIVVTDSAGTTKLSRELVSFNKTTPSGRLYFKAPTLKGATNTEFWIYWGSESASEVNSAAVWSSSFGLVAHCAGDTSSVGSYTATQTSVGKTDTTSIGSPAWSYVRTTPSKSVWNNSAISGNTWTLTAWIKSSDGTTNAIPLGLGGTYNGLISAAPSGSLTYSNYDGTGRRVLDPPVRDGSWHRVAVVARDATADSTYGVVDGTRCAAGGTYGSPLAPYSIAANIRFGINITDQSGQAWTGSLAEVHIANVERSQAWLVADANNYKSPSTFYAVSAVETNVAPTIVLPDTIYAVVGRATGIEYTQITPQIPGASHYVYTCTADSGSVGAGGWSFTPAGVGDLPIVFSVRDSIFVLGDTTVTDTVTVSVVAKDRGTGSYNVLFVGDSLFDQGAVGVDTCYSAAYASSYFTADGGASIALIGTQGTAPTLHEGHGGWDWTDYTTANGGENPFWDVDHLDFHAYFGYYGLSAPDFVVISLGGNDLYNLAYTNVALTDSVWALWAAKIDAFCDTLLSADYGYPDCKIVLPMVSLSNSRYAAWIANYPTLPDRRDNYEAAAASYRARLFARYGDGAFNANVSVCDIGASTDRTADYPANNYLHPTAPLGHVPMATAYYSHLRALIAAEASSATSSVLGISATKRGLGLRPRQGRLGIRH
jgi:hypothetical protein